MHHSKPSWAEGLEILRLRQEKLPDTVFRALTTPLDLGKLDLARYRCIVTTGIGSSSAHARYLAWLLHKYCGLPARDVSSGVFLAAPGEEAREQALVVFSQGLSPNARLPLSFAARFGCTVLVTAAGAEHGERAQALRRFEEAGVFVVPIPVDPEYDVLLRLAGPAAGYAVALRLASHCGNIPQIDSASVADAVKNAASRAEALLAGADERVFSDPITFLSTEGYGALALNLCAKVIEGMFLAAPASVDVLEFAHGWLQEASGKRRTFIGLARHALHEAAAFARVRAVLEPQHQWLEFKALLAEPFHIFEHEAGMNIMVLNAIARRQLDQREWPGKGQDRPLYSLGSPGDLDEAVPAAAPPPSGTRRLEDLTWPEVEARIKSGHRTVVIPLGAIEQHGHHLPLAVDSVIAGALAERFCLRVPGSLVAPTLQLGCSSEHMDFCGTLSLSPATLRAVVTDVVSSLIRHGFTDLVLFSAHGGNDALLTEIEPDLKTFAAPARITVVRGIERLAKVWSDASAAENVPLEISGAHAGEFETSIIDGLRPDLLRRQELRAGVITRSEDIQTLFYPSLRKHAPEGVIGDPRPAAAERAERYLASWVDFLIAEYQRDFRSSSGRRREAKEVTVPPVQAALFDGSPISGKFE